ncbi:MAG: nucleotidyltransferase family protein [Thermoproteota archaeon]
MLDAVILAAGRGTRMRPHSNAVNKEMCLIGYHPIIEYSVRGLASAGLKRVFVVLGERKSQIMEYLRDGSDLGIRIAYLFQDMKHGEGTAKAVEAAEGWISGDFMVIYGDSFFHPTDFFKEIVQLHVAKKPHATMGVYLMSRYREFGLLKVESGLVKDSLERPSEAEAEEAKINGLYPVNSGPMIFNPTVFDYIKRTSISPAGEYWITDTVKLMIRDGLKIQAYIIPRTVFWRDIGRPEARIEAEKYMLGKQPSENLGKKHAIIQGAVLKESTPTAMDKPNPKASRFMALSLNLLRDLKNLWLIAIRPTT